LVFAFAFLSVILGAAEDLLSIFAFAFLSVILGAAEDLLLAGAPSIRHPFGGWMGKPRTRK
jgi:hypothetical protein